MSDQQATINDVPGVVFECIEFFNKKGRKVRLFENKQGLVLTIGENKITIHAKTVESLMEKFEFIFNVQFTEDGGFKTK